MERFLIIVGAVVTAIILVVGVMFPNKPSPQTIEEMKSVPQIGISLPDDENFRSQVTGSQSPVLVLFTAVWCGPCKTMYQQLGQLEKDRPGAFQVVKVDVDQEKALSKHYRVEALPTLLIMHQGQVLGGQEGVRQYDNLKSLFDTLSKPASGAQPAADPQQPRNPATPSGQESITRFQNPARWAPV